MDKIKKLINETFPSETESLIEIRLWEGFFLNKNHISTKSVVL